MRHEFLGGGIVVMAGGTVLHAALSAQILARLHTQLGERDRRQIEVRDREPDGSWVSLGAGPGGMARVDALDCMLELDRLYLQAGAPA